MNVVHKSVKLLQEAYEKHQPTVIPSSRWVVQSNCPWVNTSIILANFVQAADGRPRPLNAGVKITGVEGAETNDCKEEFVGRTVWFKLNRVRL